MESMTRGVTTRELGRHVASLLDDIERTGSGVVVYRHGRPVAYLGPLTGHEASAVPDRPRVAPRVYQVPVPRIVAPKDEAGDVPAEVVAELSDRDREFMSALEASDRVWWMPHSPEEMALLDGWFELERKGLTESRGGGGWRLTRKGKRALEMLPAA